MNKHPFRDIFSAGLLKTFFVPFRGDFISKMAPKNEELSSVPKHKKAVMSFIEKIHMLAKLCSVLNYSANGWDFKINKSILIWYL